MERQLGYKGSIHWSLLLLEGICKTIAVCSVLSWYGLIRQGKLLRAVIWISVLSGLQGTVDGFTTDMKWTDKSVITDSLELSGTTEAWDLTIPNDIDRHDSVISHTQTAICHAQCTAKCCDSELLIPPVLTDDQGEENVTMMVSPEVSCISNCGKFTNDDWIDDCEHRLCVRNCGDSSPKSGTHLIPDPPYNLSLRQLTAELVYLEWMQDDLITRHSVLYVVERQVKDTWESLNMTSNTFYNTVVDVCEKCNFQVASVNQFGYNGYSSSVSRNELPAPGPIEQLQFKVPPEYQYEYFYFIYTFRPPEGWNFHDVKVKDVFHDKECINNPMPPVPITRIEESSELPGTYEAEVKIHEAGYSCNYFLSLVSYSKCDVEGKAVNFTVNITDCEALNYECPEIPFRWPAMVENVSVQVIDDEMKAFVSWPAIRDTGSSDTISSYLIQWGLVKQYAGFQLPKLTEEGRLSIVDQLNAVIYLNKTDTLYGIKIIGVVPIKENETDDLNEQIDKMASMETFTVKSAVPVSVSTSPQGHHPNPGTGTPSLVYTTTAFHKLDSSSLSMLPDKPNTTGNDLLALYITVPLVVIVAGVLVAVLVNIHRKKAQNKEDLPRQVFTQLPGYDATVMKHVQNCMESNPLYDLQTRDESPPPEGDCWEISHRHLTLGEILGRGAFGQVVKGRVKTGGIRNWRKISTSSTGSFTDDSNPEEVVVAVKMLLEFAENSHKQEFLKEMELMKKIGHHPNVVGMIGCVTRQGPLCLIVEHVPHGDLLHYLRKHRQNIQEENSDSGIREECPKLTMMDLLSMSRQIATGMEFLSQKGFVHRDLACRNILVGENRVVKVGDFGLTRFIYDDKIYVTKKGGKLPLKWMAIESIFDLTFTSASDVWSFGVVLFELITLGGTPYPTIANKDLLKELRDGHRMEKPDNCPDHLYEVMCNCWKEHARDRPTFTQLRNLMDNMIEMYCTAEYIAFDINTNRDYYTLEDSNSSREDENTSGMIISEWRTPNMNDETVTVEQVESLPKQEVLKVNRDDESSIESVHISGIECVDRIDKKEDQFRIPPVRQKTRKSGSLAVISSPALAIKMHSPLKVFRKEGDEMLSSSTCSTDQLLVNESSTHSDSQASLEFGYEMLAPKHTTKETKF